VTGAHRRNFPAVTELHAPALLSKRAPADTRREIVHLVIW
jgi:hypothetical protein